MLTTGGTGQLGRRLVTALHAVGARVSVLTRAPESAGLIWPQYRLQYIYGDISRPTSLEGALEGIDIVFHLASHSPAPEEPDIYEAESHWSVTAEGTRHLVDAALAADVKTLVYVSSVKAMGERAGAADAAATEATPACPDTLYGRAKLAAERTILGAAGANLKLHASVIRLPMVYGLGRAGNLCRMIDAVARHRFPPWPRVRNRRSALHVNDAVRAAMLVATDKRAAGEIYLVTDGMAYSTRWMYEEICIGLGRAIPRWEVPLWCLRGAAEVGSALQRFFYIPSPLTRSVFFKLAGDAWFSSHKIREELGFVSQHRLDAELPRMVHAYRAKRELAEMGRRPR